MLPALNLMTEGTTCFNLPENGQYSHLTGDDAETQTHSSTGGDEVTYLRIGQDLPVSSDSESLNFTSSRIQRLEGLEKCSKLKTLSLVTNYITKIENLNTLAHLNELELYQNRIQVIEGLTPLYNLRVLDLSFNQIRKIENLSTLVNLEKLYLSNNKITKIEGLDALKNLKLLELGSNRIRTIEGLSSLTKLEELWLGKNKITSMLFPPFLHLRVLSLQSNRLENWDGTLCTNCQNLVELYVSNNNISSLPHGLRNLTCMKVLDLSSNKISQIEQLESLEALEDLWMNDNRIEDVKELRFLRGLTDLKTIYLERNPIQSNLGPGYRRMVLDAAPSIVQLDALILNSPLSIDSNSSLGKSAMRK
ncbi:leucine-rich repeat protein LRR1 [Cardiosporidium cionae]|uniref:Leucine-rich repeat protein LRR1 n=1 Tax=Cardiosporidium cionae TaxID=476202 RepID=A0ABQ7J8D5_9APIC|nr:leucine-rich repeat protein LRR1 [Cardiosporidium cionae]|eukprot:KAF8820246.1 leucine-rich repeat protein LRR1 [Cardiosporidium cionae]